jgi:outer membrane protein assembly factor BamB
VLGGPNRNSVYAAEPVPDGFRPWRFRAGWGNAVGAPVASDGVVYVCSDDGRCTALDARTGRRQWVFTGDRGLRKCSPVVSGDLVCFADLDGTVHGLDREDGVLRWRARANRRVELVASGGVVYGVDSSSMRRGTRRDMMLAWDAATGEKLWGRNVDRSDALPALADGRIYHNGLFGYLSAFDAATGKELWTRHSGARLVGAVGTPCVADGFVYAGAGNTLCAHDADGGEPIWSREVRGLVLDAATAADGVVYFRARGGGTYAVDARTGRIRWQQDYRDGRSPLTVTGATGLIVAGPAANHLCRIELATGNRIWRRVLGTRAVSVPSVWHGVAYLASRESTVIAIDAATGVKPGRFGER